MQLKERRQKASETLPVLVQAIRRLVNKAYPKALAEVRETLSTEHFLDALVNSEMRIRIKKSRPANLNQAICLAVELDAPYKAEKKNEFGRAHLRGATGTDETKRYKDNKEDKIVEMMQAFNKKLDDLQKDLEKAKRYQAGSQRNTRISDIKNDTECFKCGQKCHWKRECKEQMRRRPQTEETPVKSAARHLRTRRRKHRRNQKRAYLGVNTSNKEAGMYIDLKINHLQTKFLVDTGATVSLVSNKIFYALDKSKRPKVGPLRQTVLTASETDLTSMGQAFFNLIVGIQPCTVEAVIADLPIDGILGLDKVRGV